MTWSMDKMQYGPEKNKNIYHKKKVVIERKKLAPSNILINFVTPCLR